MASVEFAKQQLREARRVKHLCDAQDMREDCGECPQWYGHFDLRSFTLGLCIGGMCLVSILWRFL